MLELDYKILGIIPARYGSTRFPGKPLAIIDGKTMIQRVYEQAKKSKWIKDIIVATDDERIYNHVTRFGNAVMTKQNHESGTDRCCEVLGLCNEFDYVVNIQGDQPFIQPEQIDLVAIKAKGNQITTLIKQISGFELYDQTIVKVAVSRSKEALFFTRMSIPTQYKHIGIYAYSVNALNEISKLEVSPLEKAESLEQLRWLENGLKIKCIETTLETISIDIPEDIN